MIEVDEIARTRVGLFGGSFNPPHVCHTLATLWVLQTQPIDEVWWVPTYQHAFSKRLIAFEHRRALCELATRDIARVRVCEVERDLGGESRTIDTVRALKEAHPQCDFSLIVGADILEETARWKNWEGLMELVELIVIGRSGHTSLRDAAGEGGFRLPDISSTSTRQALRGGQYGLLTSWLDQRVIDYISSRGLYLD